MPVRPSKSRRKRVPSGGKAVRTVRPKAAKTGKADPKAAVPADSDAADPVSTQVCRRVRQLRRERGWTLEELSTACGVSRSMLSQIERNRANPTLAVAFRIAQAFEMTLGDLVETPDATSNIDVIRCDDRTFHYRSDRYCRIRTLSPLHLEKDVEFYELTLKPGGTLKSAPHYEGTREFLTVQHGRVRLTSGEDITELEQGDSAHYRADIPHAIENAGDDNATVFLVDIYRNA